MSAGAMLRLAWARARRPREGLFPLFGWLALASIGASAVVFDEDNVGSAVTGAAAGDADKVLLTFVAPLVIPFFAYVATGAVLAKRRLDIAAAPLVIHGASRTRAAASQAMAAVALSAVGSGVATAIALLSAHVAFADIFTSTWIGGLAGAAYGALFTLGSSFGRRAGGRTVVLVVDILLGSGLGAVSVATPRGHLRNLFGGVAPLACSQRISTAALLLFVVAGFALAVLRARRSPRIYEG